MAVDMLHRRVTLDRVDPCSSSARSDYKVQNGLTDIHQ